VIAAMPVVTWDARRYTPEEARAIGELVARVWPKPGVDAEGRAQQMIALGRQYAESASPPPRSFVVLNQGRVVAHAALLPRRAATLDGPLLVGGLARVCSDPALRGQGLGELVARAALAPVDAGEFQFALFQTNSRVRPFYEKLGAVTVDNDVVNSLAADPTAPAFWDEVVMRYPANRPWPKGEIDLLGPGF
jgi:predicted N-acetyltransferase YhbS